VTSLAPPASAEPSPETIDALVRRLVRDEVARALSELEHDLVAVSAAGVERKGLERLIAEGKIASVKIGRRRYVRRSDLAALPVVEPPKARVFSLADAVRARDGAA